MKVIKGLLTLAVFFTASVVMAEQEETSFRMLSISAKNVKTPSAFANLLGIEYRNYHTDTFFMGGGVFTGQLSTGATGGISYGGLLAGAEVFKFSPVGMVFGLLVGGGGGFSSSNGGGFVIDATLGANFKLSQKIRGVVDVGYLWLPSATTFSGLNFSFKILFPIG